MSEYWIRFEDRGQDFLSWLIKNNKVVESLPCRDGWRGARVIGPVLRGGKVTIEMPITLDCITIQYPVASLMRMSVSPQQYRVLEMLAKVAERGSDGDIYACTYKLRPDGMSTDQTYRCLRQLRRYWLAQPHPGTAGLVLSWGITLGGQALMAAAASEGP